MNKRLFFCFILFLITVFLSAERITFSADSMSGSTKKNATATLLKGSAQIVTEEMEIYADMIELSGDDYKNIRAEGNVSGKNVKSGMEFTCMELEYDRTSKLAVLTGDVDLLDVENNVKAKAQVISYNSDTDIAIMQIGINLVQKDNICSASYAVYYKKTQMLNLSGNAKIQQKEDTFRAQQITLNMDTEEITLDGRVKGTVSEKEKSEEEKTGDENQNASQDDSESVEMTDTSVLSDEGETSEMESESFIENLDNKKEDGISNE